MRKKSNLLIANSFDESLINLTPLIDVVFVVLIAFILVAPILEFDQVELASGFSSTKNIQNKQSLSIMVRRDNSIWYNNRHIPEKELLSFFKQLKQKNPNKNLQVFHDKRAYFGTYQTIKNAAENAGFKQMDLILKPG